MIASPSVQVQIQGSRVSLKHKSNFVKRPQEEKSTGKRAKITEFSKKARRNLLDMTASFDIAKALEISIIIFITLTYGQEYPSARQAKRHLDNFKKRIAYHYPNASAVWKLEFQKRGAPHFHFIVFNLPFIDKYDLARMWGEVIGEGKKKYWDHKIPQMPRPPFTRIEALDNPKITFIYMSKYVAKEFSTEDADRAILSDADPQGENSDAEMSEASEGGFNNVPNLTKNNFDTEWVGRFWGIMNRKMLPFAELFETESEMDAVVERAFFQFRRLMAKKYKSANHFGIYRGATVYTWGNSDAWIDAWFQCLLDAQQEVVDYRKINEIDKQFGKIGA